MRQTQLDLGAGSESGGLEAWRCEQKRRFEELARTFGLPLGRSVEVWLSGSVRLRGELQLADSFLLHAQSTLENTAFSVSGTRFYYREMESCIQL